jgi:hypothetical protein
MKIIEKIDVSEWSHLCRCSNCETKLEIEATDLNYNFSDRDGIYPGSGSYSTKCPVCPHYIHVPASEIPKIIQVDAQKRATQCASSYYHDR